MQLSPSRAWLAGRAAALILFQVQMSWTREFPGLHDIVSRISDAECPLQDTFDWKSVEPSPELSWVPCYDGFQCARFETPLDYNDPSGRKAQIATIKWPSKYAANDTRYRGAIFSNPGGPGAGGVDFLLAAAPIFTELIGDDYDHISFDPRGVRHTTPAPLVYKSEAERRAWEGLDFNAMNYTLDGVGRTLARAEVLGRIVRARDTDDGSSVHLGTADVARDIVALNAALGRDKIMYYGGSYGTVLGATLAAMYPDKIERMVLDSVMEAGQYYSTTWTDNFIHVDEVLAFFFKSCSVSSACALHEATPEAVRARYNRVVESLKAKPVPVVDGDVYAIVDWPLMTNYIFSWLYGPYANFGPMAEALAGLEKGNGSLAYSLTGGDSSTWTCNCDKGLPQVIQVVSTAIKCGDGDPVNDTLDELKEWYAKQVAVTTFAEAQSLRPLCAGWKIQAKHKFKGPITANTSHPIFIINNTLDPATPIEMAHQTAERFLGSVVLAIDAPGHGAIVTPSVCMAKYFKEYVREGTLPPAGTLCKADKSVFPPDDETMTKRDVLSAEDQHLLDTLVRLQAKVSLPRII